MYRTVLRLPAEYWAVIDSYGSYNTTINNAVAFVLQESLVDLPMSRESNEGVQISRNVTIVNREYEILHELYGASRHISLRRIITYLVDNGLYEAFSDPHHSSVSTLTPTEDKQYQQIYKLLYKVLTAVSTLEQYDKTGTPRETFTPLYDAISKIKEYYHEKYITQSANRNNTIRVIRERSGANPDTDRAGDTDD